MKSRHPHQGRVEDFQLNDAGGLLEVKWDFNSEIGLGFVNPGKHELGGNLSYQEGKKMLNLIHANLASQIPALIQKLEKYEHRADCWYHISALPWAKEKEGDMRFPPGSAKNHLKNVRWPGGVVPYVIEGSFSK